MQIRPFHSAHFSSHHAGHSAGATSLVFPWWSFTKTVLSICALRLVEEERLSLDELRPEKPFTLRQLLQHRAGVPDYGPLKAYHDAVARNETPWSRECLVQAVGADRLDFPPGTAWCYSNVGYMFVREAIEEAAGLPLAAAIQSLVLAPLRLQSVRLAAEPSDFNGVFWPAARTYDPRWVYHGCLIGTPVDAARVLRALVCGQILKSATLQTMLVCHELGGAGSGRPWTACGYGLGLMIGKMGDAGRAIGHSGGGPGCVTAVYHFPDRDDPITVATFTDGQEAGAAEFEAAAIALRELAAAAIRRDLAPPADL